MNDFKRLGAALSDLRPCNNNLKEQRRGTARRKLDPKLYEQRSTERLARKGPLERRAKVPRTKRGNVSTANL